MPGNTICQGVNCILKMKFGDFLELFKDLDIFHRGPYSLLAISIMIQLNE